MKKFILRNVFLSYFIKFKNRNLKILNDSSRKTKKNKVNLHWWSMKREDDFENVGDYLSLIICNFMLNKKEMSFEDAVDGTKHIYGVGSIIQGGAQNATIWGSGLKHGDKDFNWIIRATRRLDVRLVRGPLTREALLNNGYKCPEKYGDPALIMPLIYKPDVEKTKPYLVILHHETNLTIKDFLSPVCEGYKSFIDELCSANLVISSSLHGIILAETYGIPAILLMDHETNNMFKYNDYYYSTGRKNYPIAKTVEEALTLEPAKIPDFTKLRENILSTFPYDLWEEKES